MASGRHSPPRGRIIAAVLSVTMLAGLLFATNARLLAGKGPSASDVAGQVQKETRLLNELRQEQDELLLLLDSLLAQEPAPDESDDGGRMDFASGRTPVGGPGVSVTLDDAVLPGQTVEGLDAYVVHQQDVEAVINTLWMAGAEAIALQGVRIDSLTTIRCVGNVLLVGGKASSPPYVVEAIGDEERLVQALATSPALEAYRRASQEIGLTWSVSTRHALRLPGASGGSISLRFARGKSTGEVR